MSKPQSALTPTELLDLYFMEHRAKLIDLAAFLDRVDRGLGTAPDCRMAAFRQALNILCDTEPGRARRVLELFSDHTVDMPESAQGVQGAIGAAPLEGIDRS